MYTLHSQRGISLIELIMFIIIISVALAGILLVMNQTSRFSADPLIHKQALAVAESLLEEVELMPFTYCDPDDPTATTATSAVIGVTGCTARVEGQGADVAFGPYQTSDETRYSTTAPFDNVNDYDQFTMNGIRAITDGTTVIGGLEDYSASVTVTTPATLFSPSITPIADRALITVTVTGRDGIPVVLEGIRTRYSPQAVP